MAAPVLNESRAVWWCPLCSWRGAIAVCTRGGRADSAGWLHTPCFLTFPCLVSQPEWLSYGFWTYFLCHWGSRALQWCKGGTTALRNVRHRWRFTILTQALSWRWELWVCVRRVSGVWGGSTACLRESREEGLGGRKAGPFLLLLLLWQLSGLQGRRESCLQALKKPWSWYWLVLVSSCTEAVRKTAASRRVHSVSVWVGGNSREKGKGRFVAWRLLWVEGFSANQSGAVFFIVES